MIIHDHSNQEVESNQNEGQMTERIFIASKQTDLR